MPQTDQSSASDLLERVLFQQTLQHQLPWRVESDWTEEVITSDGYCIAKCQTLEEAVSIIAVAMVAAGRAASDEDEAERNTDA
jgi:hypothetical protein